MSLNVFISHATADDKPVDEIHTKLINAGLQTWVDHLNGITYGTNWSRAIHEAANLCDVGLFVMSPTSVRSEYCEAEWNKILMLGKPLYIVMIEPVPVSQIPTRLCIIQYTDFTHGFNMAMTNLIAAIVGHRKLDPQAPTTRQTKKVSGNFPRWHLDLPLIGRDVEITSVRTSLTENTRVTAVLGLGGVGKTRLAAEIVSQGDFRDGVIWHTIEAHTTLDHLTALAREHLGLDASQQNDAIWASLEGKEVLVVLDNAEDCAHPKAYADRINALDLSRGMQILMTSRKQWRELHGVKYHDLRAPSADAAVNILKAMARNEPPAYSLDSYAEKLADASRNHPRLMQYAVRWLDSYPPDYVLKILHELKGIDAEAALNEIILKTVQQVQAQPNGEVAIAALQRLAVCRGGVTFEAAQTIMNAEPVSLALLKQWGLVTFTAGRYDIDPLVIMAVGEDITAHQAHYYFFKTLAEKHNEVQDYLGLDSESANLEVAFEWAMETGNYEAAYWLYKVCGNFLANRGRFDQRRDWIERVAEKLRNYLDKSVLAAVLNSLGLMYQDYPVGDRRSNLQRAIAACEESLEYRKPENAPLEYAETQNSLGNAFCILSELEFADRNLQRAIEAFTISLEYRKPENTPLEYAETQNSLGNAYIDLAQREYWAGNHEQWEQNLQLAIDAYEAAIKYRTPEVAPLAYAATQNNLAIAWRNLSQGKDREENLRRAVAAYEAALKYRTPEVAPLAYANTRRNLGITLEGLGDIVAAISSWQEAQNYYTLLGLDREANLMSRWISKAH